MTETLWPHWQRLSSFHSRYPATHRKPCDGVPRLTLIRRIDMRHKVHVCREPVPPSGHRLRRRHIDPVALCPPARRAGENFRNIGRTHPVYGGHCRYRCSRYQWQVPSVPGKFSGTYAVCTRWTLSMAIRTVEPRLDISMYVRADGSTDVSSSKFLAIQPARATNPVR